MFNLFSLKKSVDGVVQHRNALLKQLEDLQREREDIITAPVSRDDIKSMVARWVTEGSQHNSEHVQRTLQRFINRPGLVENGKHTQFSLMQSPAGGVHITTQHADFALCLLFGEQITSALHAVIDRMDWPANARPMDGRSERINAIDLELAELGRQEAEIVALARGAGVVFD